MAESESYDRTVDAKRALVRRPSARLAEGQLTHIERSPVDTDLAMQQWDGYIRAFIESGWRVTEVEPAPDCPDGVFVEDTVVVYGDLAVVARSGAVERRPETKGTEAALAEAGYRIARIEAPGVLDGGDVLKHDGTVYVGQSTRTNADGIRQLAEHLAPFGATVITVPLTKALHLKSAVTALPDGTVIGYEPVVDDPVGFRRVRGRPGGTGRARRAARRGQAAHVIGCPADRGDAAGARLRTGARRRRRVREARGLRDMPFGSPARHLSPLAWIG